MNDGQKKLLLFTLLGLLIGIGIAIALQQHYLSIIDELYSEKRDLKHKLQYTSQMMYGVHDSLGVSGIHLYPNQLAKNETAELFVWVENNNDDPQDYSIEIEPYNTEKIEITPKEQKTKTLDWNETEMLKFNVFVNDDAGLYFTTWLEISIFDTNSTLLDNEKVFFVVTTDFDRSMEERLFEMIEGIKENEG